MLLPLEAAEPQHLSAEICVIGSGPTGQAVSRSLASSGLEVLVVEAGDIDATRWGRRFASAATPSIGRHYPNAGHQVLVRVGGTSALWGVHLRPGSDPGTGNGLRLGPLDAVDLADRPAIGIEGWPLSVDELRPWYRQAEQLFGLGPDRAWQTTAIDDDPNVSTELYWAVPSTPVLEPDIDGARLLYRCPIRTLIAGPDGRITSAVGVARNGDEVEIRADVFVLALGTIQTTRLLLDSPWAGAPSMANSSGLVGRYLTDHPQLSLGQLVLHHSAELSKLEPLAPSAEQGPDGPILRWPNLATSPARAASGELTRLAVSLLPLDRVPPLLRLRNRLPRPLGARTGAVSAVAELRDAVDRRQLDWAAIRRLPSLIGGLDEVLAESDHRFWSDPAWRVEDPHWAHLLNRGGPAAFELFAVAEQRPAHDNRVVLSDQRNQIGARKPLVEWRWSADDQRLAERAADDIRALLADLGVGDILVRQGRAAIHKINSHHAAGTTRMSLSPDDGVVDPDLRSHDHPNLYIAGSAAFRATGSSNPTLTDVAIGLRLADHLS